MVLASFSPKYTNIHVRNLAHLIIGEDHPILLPTAREGNVFTGVCLCTISLMATQSLLGLVTVRSVQFLLECFLVISGF